MTAPPSNGIHSGEISALVDFAAAAELIHAASLIHDDVIDKAAERRRRPSANKLFGNHTAVLAGDYMFASAFELLTAHASLGVIPLMTEAIRQMCLGEMAQKQRLYDATLCEDAYFQRIQHKTASLLAACAEGGVLVAGGSPEQARQFQRYGVKLGMAYQIADDIIDFESTDETAGKPTGQDIVNGIYTLPLLRMPDREHWMQRLRRGGDVAADITALRQALHDCGALVSAKQTAKQLAQEAADAIVDYTGQRHPLLQWC